MADYPCIVPSLLVMDLLFQEPGDDRRQAITTLVKDPGKSKWFS